MHAPLHTTLIVLLGASLGTAEEKKQSPPPAKVPDPVVRNASVVIDGREIDYKVTAAKLQLKKEDGQVRADIFHLSYERTGIENPAERPVLFAFNGGPGSSAVWLHLGALGPRLVPTTPDGTEALEPPHRVIPNPHSILDVADLVFRKALGDPIPTVNEWGIAVMALLLTISGTLLFKRRVLA